jgi:hypothetical protein
MMAYAVWASQVNTDQPQKLERQADQFVAVNNKNFSKAKYLSHIHSGYKKKPLSQEEKRVLRRQINENSYFFKK